MKILPVFMLAICCSYSSPAQTIRDSSLYSAGIQLIDLAHTKQQFLKAADFFTKISMEHDAHWLANYYAGLSYVLASYHNLLPFMRDSLIDRAQEEVDRGLSMNPGEPELMILQAFVFQARIQVDPLVRGMTYSMKASSILQKVMQEDPENPRAYLLMAYQTYYAPGIIGGGPANAFPLFIKARDKFTSYIPESDIHPRWGAEETYDMIDVCRQESGAQE
ncbi:MAG: hypothetical protein JXA61_04855 [Bacteroidales bacterium]|nr:hypothetical protein [Bacteroidales bacterium]